MTKLGAPGSTRREQLRRAQAEFASRPLHADLARLFARRISAYPLDGGLPSVAGFDPPAGEGELAEVRPGTPIPAAMLDKLARALEAPIAELIERGVITSGEALRSCCRRSPHRWSRQASTIPWLRELFGQIYAAFRRRRSLLLLNLEHQVQIDR